MAAEFQRIREQIAEQDKQVRYGRPQGNPILESKFKASIEYKSPQRVDPARQYAQARLAQDAVESYQHAIAKHQVTFGKQGPIQISASKMQKNEYRKEDGERTLNAKGQNKKHKKVIDARGNPRGSSPPLQNLGNGLAKEKPKSRSPAR